ncbi:MAG: DUF4249 domain-containing protein [Flavobacterium sp.]|nr:DUF4249 domain-containing protein [Flavobacterium sp.]
MKLYKIITLFILTILASSCEDVIEVDLETASPKLVVFASIQWKKGTSGNEQKVRLTTTTGYFDEVIPTVSGADVTVTNAGNTVFNFIETPNTGEYKCSNFDPVIDQEYVLTIKLNGQTYTATETLKSVPTIKTTIQKNDGGFTGEEIEIKSFFDDPVNEDNYYMFKFKSSALAIPSYDIFDDSFTQGNENFGLYINEELESGDNLDITLFGISKRYFEYMRKLTAVAGSTSGGPFATAPASVRGNIVNQTNFKNFAFGYFNLSETDYRNYVVE